ncbi:hypothetical protein EYV94_06120 [Puteibacter caeruleilacunae]|nr:hypothetical protein EYV94_06120 [Puteibacter caeruleilacunae]
MNMVEEIRRKIFLLSVLLIVFSFSWAQTVMVKGKVLEASTETAVPYANIVFKGTLIGTMTDVEGNFKIWTNSKVKELEISAIGYESQVFDVDSVNGKNITVRLQSDVYELNEIIILPTENPAHPILRNIIKNKKYNNPDKMEDWQCEVYNKLQIDIKNVKKPQKSRKLWKQFDFVFDHIDTLETDGKTFLPVFITETVSDLYHEERTGDRKEVIVASKASGLESSTVTQFTGSLYQDLNIYDNYLMVGDVGLVSPINDQGLSFYRYYLQDSTIIDGHMVYDIAFKPKHKQTPTFKGKLQIDKDSYAVRRYEFQLNENANVNFINSLVAYKRYHQIDDHWLPQVDHVFADLNLKDNEESKMLGLLGRKTTHYKNYEFVKPPQAIVSMNTVTEIKPGALDKENDYWEQMRPELLSMQEANIYQMVDSLKNVPLFRTVTDVVELIFFGYEDIGKFEVGPYYYMYSYNAIEGHRFRFGGRTTKEFDENWRLSGYLAGGTRDNALKYNVGADYYIDKIKIKKAGLSYTHDYTLLGKSENAFMEDNFLTAVLSRHTLAKLNMQNKFEAYYEHEWVTGIKNKLIFKHQQLKSSPFVQFKDREGGLIPNYRQTEVELQTRLAFGEKFMLGDFERTVLGSKYPTFNLSLKFGLKDVLNSDFNYVNASLSFYDKLPVNPIGYFAYYVQCGKIWGDVPFPFLKIHEGNETYAHDLFAFNLMNYHEFVSDKYASLSVEHHFNGFFLNKIPLFRKLKWREVIAYKALWGSLDMDNPKLVLAPEMSELGSKPYMEASLGIENIFKFVRIDGVWRLNYDDMDYEAENFGLMFSVHFKF